MKRTITIEIEGESSEDVSHIEGNIRGAARKVLNRDGAKEVRHDALIDHLVLWQTRITFK